MAFILALVVGGIVLFYRQLLVSTFDPGLATSLGIPAAAVNYALMGVLSLTIVASFEAVGAILAVALLVLPGATARLWTDRMPSMLLFSAAIIRLSRPRTRACGMSPCRGADSQLRTNRANPATQIAALAVVFMTDGWLSQ